LHSGSPPFFALQHLLKIEERTYEMTLVSEFLPLARRFYCRRALQCSLLFLSLAAVAAAKPVTYVGFTIADGKLGNWTFHNARVYFVMQGDTDTVQAFEAPNPVDPTDPVDVLINPAGNSSVTVISGSQVAHATFDPNQIFVSMDIGLAVERPHIGGRGVGFGMFTPTGIEPVYPFGIEDGTIDWGDLVEGGGTASISLQALPISLSDATSFSGRAFACVGFASDGNAGSCQTALPLHTDKGRFLHLFAV